MVGAQSADDGRLCCRLCYRSPCGYGLFIGQLGNWSPGNCRAITGDHRRLISSIFDFSLPTDRPALGNRVSQWVWPLRQQQGHSLFGTLDKSAVPMLKQPGKSAPLEVGPALLRSGQGVLSDVFSRRTSSPVQ